MAQTTPTTKTTTMTINLRKRLIKLHTPRRRKRASGLVREAVARYSKSDPEKVKLNHELSEFIAKNASGASFMWAKLKLNIEKTDSKVEVKMYSQKPQAAQPAAKVEEKKQAAKEPKQQKQA